MSSSRFRMIYLVLQHMYAVMLLAGTDNQEKDEKQSQNDKTGLTEWKSM
ncbi:hypothetical protein Tco_1566995, partial [Tanacetum coccineum]